jgi:hypothetical protein
MFLSLMTSWEKRELYAGICWDNHWQAPSPTMIVIRIRPVILRDRYDGVIAHDPVLSQR